MKINLGGAVFNLNLAEKETGAYFNHFEVLPSDHSFSNASLQITENELMHDAALYSDSFGVNRSEVSLSFIEYNSLQMKAANILVSMDRCLFHGLSFKHDNKAFILSGPSGIGKTTQYRNLKNLFPDYIRIMNGDKPILRFEDDSVYVYPSPWAGKENYGSGRTGRLDGIIYLKQESHNSIRRLPVQESVLPIVSQFIYSARDERTIRYVCNLAGRLLRNVPVWEFSNNGSEASSQYLCKNLFLGVPYDI